jgi:diguanylate cyclase (GGDEF)-like protein
VSGELNGKTDRPASFFGRRRFSYASLEAWKGDVLPANTRAILSRAILPIAGYWSLLVALSMEAESPSGLPDYVLPVIVLLGLPLVTLASIILFRDAHNDGSLLALRDDLTGVGNRRAFVAHSQGLIRKARAGTLGLILLDVDGLKQLNDSCGHQAGDELLSKVAQHVGAKGKLYRIGGDEFAVLIDRAVGQHMTTLMQALEPFIATFEACGHAHEVRVSFGSTSNRENEKFQDLFRRADDSLIQHKRQLYSRARQNDRRSSEGSAPSLFQDEVSSTEATQKHLRLLS